MVMGVGRCLLGVVCGSQARWGWVASRLVVAGGYFGRLCAVVVGGDGGCGAGGRCSGRQRVVGGCGGGPRGGAASSVVEAEGGGQHTGTLCLSHMGLGPLGDRCQVGWLGGSSWLGRGVGRSPVKEVGVGRSEGVGAAGPRVAAEIWICDLGVHVLMLRSEGLDVAGPRGDAAAAAAVVVAAAGQESDQEDTT